MEEDGKTENNKKPEPHDVFEEDILQITEKDEDLMSHKIFQKNFRGKCFIKTKFHYEFLKKISTARLTSGQKIIFVGIQGIGKSTSAMYYVLSCRKQNDDGIHYADLNAIEAIDKKLEKFKQYADSVTNDCLVVDHVTLFNMPLVKEIEKITQYTQIILIETGFTASAHPTTGLDFNKDSQLDVADFEKIWKGSLSLKVKNSSLYSIGHKVYNELSKELIVTPRLLHNTLDDMMLHNLKVEAVLYSAICKFREEIFNIDVKDPQYERFILDTKTLLELVKLDKMGFITTLDTLQEFKVAINIFDVRTSVVTQQDLKVNYRLLELDLKEGDPFVVVNELIPCLHRFWVEKFPFKCEDILYQNNAKDILLRIIVNGGMRKEFDKAIVKFQEENNLVIIPDDYVFTDTESFESLGKCVIEQCIGVVKPRQSLLCYKPDQDELKAFFDNTTESYDIPLRNVHKTALFIKEKINKNFFQSLLVYPAVQNLVGFDYFIFTETSQSHSVSGDDLDSTCSSLSSKRKRIGCTLFLIQVATGFSHTGLTMHKALEVFKNTIKEVPIHIVVLTASKYTGPYTLTGNCSFKNISVINIGEEHYLKFLKSCLRKDDFLVIDAIVSSSVED